MAKQQRPLLLCLLGLLHGTTTDAFTVAPTRSGATCVRTAAGTTTKCRPLRMTIETVNLESSLDDDHEAEGTRLAASIAGWLDVEWMPQEVHLKMGENAKQTYITARNSGDHDVMSIMHTVAENLHSNWEEYDRDAFVNAWDIGNYVSDYLVARAGGETCGCSAAIFDPDA